ncbi:type III-B CRISPR module-associated protein Cmr3 [Thermococcus sp. Bubb.Bath]|uniref:type III-B CRISPR module-associated protein Cmr3 n=1 Tax=Thermococcus sp. Bubb.Bath TaxID=1638242 RepID=UPI0014397309|nr:type III-B CRISPR module-associated protein Cmr3 [Thermococcus sp. Bubb.Bath]NJF24413.1 type III-B CRISPR module-associated protein Cmr3 [Thermococcus sp. Bubb.Bath]
MIKMTITPYDVLFFRESRDFSAGENHVAESIEPMPHTIAGAIMGFLYHTEERRKLIDLKNKKPNFSIQGAFFSLNDEPLFRIPMDVVEAEEKLAFLEPHKTPSDNPDNWAVMAVREGKRTLHFSPANGFIDYGTLKDYLGGTLSPGVMEEDIIEPEKVYKNEVRVGIGLNSAKTTEEGLLYRITTLRFKENAGIVVYVSKNEEELQKVLGSSGILKLGGESRFAEFKIHPSETEEFPLNSEPIELGKTFKLYFATPLIINGNSVTEFFEKEIEGAKVLKIFTDRPIPVTGWDMEEKKPKPIRWALPAGTVVWMRAEGNVTVAPKIGEMKEFGYGLVFVGKFRG